MLLFGRELLLFETLWIVGYHFCVGYYFLKYDIVTMYLTCFYSRWYTGRK
jgi:hypothetical protein